ncbi:hypothetical protein M433DRAFT_135046 [Acidomyces richmondensis BFW]|nr:MAG: hypothetical protein FE78DRAFT_71601 [Acidomyces sp. 'richmondensis']KYG45055.1 hypothetical protein M433DRAFT_135046 [Acidomyces richmondensis BFW]
MASSLSAALRTHTIYRPTAIPFQLRITQQTRRSFQTSHRRLQNATTTKRPVGAFRGTLFGFLLGSILAGGGLYYYIIEEYKVSNELLTEDIYALQAAVQRLETYVKSLEDEVKLSKK